MTINLYLVPRLRMGGTVSVPNVVLIPLKTTGYFIYYNVQHSQILLSVHGVYIRVFFMGLGIHHDF
jgi:hypothetical protein